MDYCSVGQSSRLLLSVIVVTTRLLQILDECALGHPGFQLSYKSRFPYDRPDSRGRLSRFKIFRDDLDDWGDW